MYAARGISVRRWDFELLNEIGANMSRAELTAMP